MDELLDGGVMNGELVEICGPVASGKTQASFCETRRELNLHFIINLFIVRLL